MENSAKSRNHVILGQLTALGFLEGVGGLRFIQVDNFFPVRPDCAGAFAPPRDRP